MSESHGNGLRSRLVAAALLLAPLLATACSAPGMDRPPVVETLASSPPPAMSAICSDPAQIEKRVRDVVDAYNAGDVSRGDSFFAPEGKFQWYSENGLREGAAARDRSTLMQYLSKRHLEGDEFSVARVEPGSAGNFGFFINRGAKTEILSKGALDCATGLVIVWSLGPNPGP